MVSLFIATSVLIQNLFAKAYGGNYNEQARSIIQTADGGYAVVGSTSSYGYEILVLKLNPDGTRAWARTYGGSSGDYGLSIIQTSDGGYAVAGETNSFGAGLRDVMVIKLNSDGSVAWARVFGASGYEYVAGITQTTNGDYIVAGHTAPYGSADYDFFIVKLNSDGSMAWAKKLGRAATSYTEWAYSVTRTSDGGCAVAGEGGGGAGAYDFLVGKYNSDGSLAWAYTYGRTGFDHGRSIIQTVDGGYAVAGHSYSFGSRCEALVLKLTPDGSVSWARTYGGASYDSCYSIVQTTDGGYALAGATWSFGSGSADCFAFKINSSGALTWARTYGTTSWDYIFSITQTSNGDYVLAGQIPSGSYTDLIVLKLNANGDYSGCVTACSPGQAPQTVNRNAPATSSDWSPSVTTPALNSAIVSPNVSDRCQPLYEDIAEGSPGQREDITCSPVPGGLLFISPTEIPVSIYSAEGRLAYSGSLKRGETRVPLEQGVYLWMAGTNKGKVAAR